ncbi:uncharacterized protein LOC123654910 [Melitaea cinxia]|uniref:uncharacterized protein LOC123654910 n=1 Tax=Melitaea cinxia TaxID=113334 RepID=UPI001E26FCC6|nr:uncharacterized protein LOC123654910 [Melitaea cinxia]
MEFRSALEYTRCFNPSGPMIITVPSFVQHLLTPKRCRAVWNNICRLFVKNSDNVIPDPFNVFFEYHTLSRREASLNLTNIALGRSGLGCPKRCVEYHAQVISSAVYASPTHQIAWTRAPLAAEDSPMQLKQTV